MDVGPGSPWICCHIGLVDFGGLAYFLPPLVLPLWGLSTGCPLEGGARKKKGPAMGSLEGKTVVVLTH